MTAVMLALSQVTACATSTTARLGLPPLQTVDSVTVSKYMGVWFEIASIPQRFQKGCTDTQATYTLTDAGTVNIVNACRKGADTQPVSAQGQARVVAGSNGAKLRVSFFLSFLPFFWGDYWIVDLASDYSYAAVGSPGRDTLWILSRTPNLPDATYQHILAHLGSQGYDVNRLQKTVHSAH